MRGGIARWSLTLLIQRLGLTPALVGLPAPPLTLLAILVSGDTDFADALQAVKDLGHHVEVALFDPRGSQRLRDVADRIIRIDILFLADCWL